MTTRKALARKVVAGAIAVSLSATLVGTAGAEGVDPATAEAQIDEWVANGDIRERVADRLERKVDRVIAQAERKAARGVSDERVIKTIAKRLRLSQDEVRDILSIYAVDADQRSADGLDSYPKDETEATTGEVPDGAYVTSPEIEVPQPAYPTDETEATTGETPDGTQVTEPEIEVPQPAYPTDETEATTGETPDGTQVTEPEIEAPASVLVDLEDIPEDMEAAFDLAVIEDRIEKIAQRRNR